MKEHQDPTLDRYLNGDYAQKNPDWDRADASWKARKLHQLLVDHDCQPSSIVEIGCGSGAVLAALRDYFPQASLAGFDIAPEAKRFWGGGGRNRDSFRVGGFLGAGGACAGPRTGTGRTGASG